MTLAQTLFSRHNAQQAWTVEEVTELLRTLVVRELPWDFWLCGELILNDRATASVHLYATVRDEKQNTLPLVYFGGAAVVRSLGLKSGDKVLAWGHISFYAPRCDLQFQASKLVKADGGGDTLTELRKKALERLTAEGLLDPKRKKPLPPFPKTIGLVTSPDAAGFRDFLHTCLTRAPRLSFLLAPTKVQGKTAAAECAAALRLLDDLGECDVIVITRGGGSEQDLWCFNDEALARAIAQAKTPVLTAIGHEKDTPLVDYVADASAITPTKAAELLTEPLFLAANQLKQLQKAASRALNYTLQNRRTRLRHCLESPYLQSPEKITGERKNRLLNIEVRLAQALPYQAKEHRAAFQKAWDALLTLQNARLNKFRARLEQLLGTLHALDPKGVLHRGYSILLNRDGHAIRTAAEAPEGTQLTAMLATGSLGLEVISNQNP